MLGFRRRFHLSRYNKDNQDTPWRTPEIEELLQQSNQLAPSETADSSFEKQVADGFVTLVDLGNGHTGFLWTAKYFLDQERVNIERGERPQEGYNRSLGLDHPANLEWAKNKQQTKQIEVEQHWARHGLSPVHSQGKPVAQTPKPSCTP